MNERRAEDPQIGMVVNMLQTVGNDLRDQRQALSDMSKSIHENAIKTERLIVKMDNINIYIKRQAEMTEQLSDHEVRLKLTENIGRDVEKNKVRITNLEHYRIKIAGAALCIVVVSNIVFEIFRAFGK